MNIQEKSRLKGHSGCILELENCNGKILVNKKSNDFNYNKRLEIQCNKQREYWSEKFKAVKVFDKGFDEAGFFWFSMEYINGLTFADYMKIAKLSHINYIADIFLSIVPENLLYDNNACDIFLSKIDDLSENIKDKTKIIKTSLQRLKNYSWDYLQGSSCHGDLTLENIIISNNELYLIDFLDSFYDSWQIDIAKILQDIEIFWHYRREKVDINLFIRLLVLKKLILKKLFVLNDGEEVIKSIYHILLLNLLRILPYTKDKFTSDFLQSCLVSLNNKIEEEGWRKEL
jgi:serine/threonine protein kinase